MGCQPATGWPVPVAFGSGFSNQTIRNIVHTSVGGRALRIRLTNAFGKDPLEVGAVTVGVQKTGASLVPGTNKTVTFGGQTAVLVAPGAESLSDLVAMDVDSEQNLAISLFIPGTTGAPTLHLTAVKTNYVTDAGNFTSANNGNAFTHTSLSWYFVDGVDVTSKVDDDAGAIVALGDSITDSVTSTVDANHRWPNLLAHRLLQSGDDVRLGVVDEGISGNRVLNDSACLGVNAQARLDRDVLTQDGVRFVILLEGINDIGFSAVAPVGIFGACAVPNTDVSANQIISGYQQIIARAHAKGLKIFGGTLTPFKGAGYFTTAGEVKRETVNEWIRAAGHFDGVIDFDAATRDPANPQVFRPEFDSGDHLHPNDAGYQAMANAIDLRLFRR